MGLGSVTKAIWTLLQGTTSPDVVALYNYLYEKLEGPKLEKGGIGNIFFVNGVDGVGDNANSGLTPDQPFLTITYALSQCVTEHNDVIVILNYWQPTGEVWPIVVNKRQVHILGAAMGNLPYPAIHPPGDTACFQVDDTGCYSEIAFLTIGGGNSHGGIELSVAGQAEGVWLHDLTFGHVWFGTPQNGVWISTDGLRHTFGIRIEKCVFVGGEGNFHGALTAEAILQSTGGGAEAHDLEILNNIFKGCAAGITLGTAFDAVIKGNRFGVNDGGGVDQAIDLGATCLGCLIDDNHSASRMAAGSTSTAFSDQAGGVANAWGLNTVGGAYEAAV